MRDLIIGIIYVVSFLACAITSFHLGFWHGWEKGLIEAGKRFRKEA